MAADANPAPYDLDKMAAAGGRRWQQAGHDRMYLPADTWRPVLPVEPADDAAVFITITAWGMNVVTVNLMGTVRAAGHDAEAVRARIEAHFAVLFGADAPEPAAADAPDGEPEPEAARPDQAAIDAWLPRVAGDGYAALLVATAELANTTLNDLIDQARGGEISAAPVHTARRIARATRADVRQYFGETFADQATDVIRIAR